MPSPKICGMLICAPLTWLAASTDSTTRAMREAGRRGEEAEEAMASSSPPWRLDKC